MKNWERLIEQWYGDHEDLDWSEIRDHMLYYFTESAEEDPEAMAIDYLGLLAGNTERFRGEVEATVEALESIKPR